LIAVSGSGTLTYLHADRIGSVVAVTDSSGAITNKIAYSAFGESSRVTGSTFGFTGQRYDSDTGLYYYKHRFYNPAIGRFLQPDPLGYGDLNCDCDCTGVTTCGCDCDEQNV
jgi:RHS repeat-associated protein